MTKINQEQYEKICEVVRDHLDEITEKYNDAPKGWVVMFEVTPTGEWRGAGVVTQGTTSQAAYKGETIPGFIKVIATTPDDIDLENIDEEDAKIYFEEWVDDYVKSEIEEWENEVYREYVE